jgi:hypothetical protein
MMLMVRKYKILQIFCDFFAFRDSAHHFLGIYDLATNNFFSITILFNDYKKKTNQ